MKSMIRVQNVKKAYHKQTVVDDVSFEVQEGEIFGLLGPNGAGKTTTMEMMEGLRPLDGGDIWINGKSVRKQKKELKKEIGVQLQSTSLFDLLTVQEILRLYASFYEHHIPVETVIENMQLHEKKDAYVKQLSGGQKQRLAIGIALIHDPNVVFLDEPTTGLDPQARRSLWDIIRRLQETQKTVILSTHYMEEAHTLCNRLVIMDHGQIITSGAPDELIAELDQDNGTLEDVFLHLTGRSLREE